MKSLLLEDWFCEAFSPGWGYLVENNGKKTLLKGYPSSAVFKHHLGLSTEYPSYLAIRPNRLQTSWIALDIDQARSKHHPDRAEGALERLLERCRLLGLKCPLIFRSSYSRGIHLWFPLQTPVNTFRAACIVRNNLQAAVVECGETGDIYGFAGDELFRLFPGELEIFPNVKSYGSDYQLIRLPFTGHGSGLFLDGFGLVDEPGVLPGLWSDAAHQNCLISSKLIQEREEGSGPYNLALDRDDGELEFISLNWIQHPPQSRRSMGIAAVSAVKGEGSHVHSISVPGCVPPSFQEAVDLLARGWTGAGQTQAFQLAALMVAGAETNDSLVVSNRVRDLLMSAPGFEIFCGHVDEIRKKQMPGRSACSRAAVFSPIYEGSWKQRANQRRSEDASFRAVNALVAAALNGLVSRSISSAINELANTYGSPRSKRWWYSPGQCELLAELKAMLSRE